jgi:hypothetical protein
VRLDHAVPDEAVSVNGGTDDSVSPDGQPPAGGEEGFRLAIVERDAQPGVYRGGWPRLLITREYAREVLPVAGLGNTAGTCSVRMPACGTAARGHVKRDQDAEYVDPHRRHPSWSPAVFQARCGVPADSFEQVAQALGELPGGGVRRELVGEAAGVPAARYLLSA